MRFKKFTALALAVVTAASVAMTGCGSRIDEDAVVATLGDKEISLGLANFMAQYTAVSYDSYITMGYAKENMWSQDLSGNGKTMQDNVKDGILTQIQTNYLLEDHMKDYGVEITDESFLILILRHSSSWMITVRKQSDHGCQERIRSRNASTEPDSEEDA